MLAHMSTDYYARLEQQRGPQPSEQMLAAIARALRLTQDERDHLFRLAGHVAGAAGRRTDHVNPALMRVLERLDTPAQVMSDLGETLVQNELAVALVGDQTRHTGLSAQPAVPLVHRSGRARRSTRGRPAAPRPRLRRPRARRPRPRPRRRARAELVEALLGESPEFAALWAEHEVTVRLSDHKRFCTRASGTIELYCQHLIAADEGQVLLVYTATPGTEDADKLRLLSVIGSQRFDEPARS